MPKSIFEATKIAAAPLASRKDDDKYAGPERRRLHRRSAVDRRGEVRFDINSSDRRSNPGRRNDDVWANTSF